MRSSFSLVTRGILAVLLTIGFYALALGIAALCLFIIYLQVMSGTISIRLSFFCLVIAGIILWAIFPRLDRFQPPGPRLLGRDYPELFKSIRDVAHRTRQKMPVQVYLVPDVNAFVAERGGFMGIGSRRVMGIGLPLLQTLTVSQLCAVIAHEFGHFYGGDTKLAPWVYKTRGAIIRTVTQFSGSFIQAPFRWYAQMFLRITHGISRQQELRADRTAAEVVGPQALAEGLEVIHGTAPAYQAYLSNEVLPVVQSGFRPRLAQGFDLFLRAEGIDQAIHKGVEEELKSGKTDPYDTHPSLADRLAAARAITTPERIQDARPANSLIGDIAPLEHKLMSYMLKGASIPKFEPIEWRDTGSKVYIPHWQQSVAPFRECLMGIRVADIPKFLIPPNAVSRKIREMGGDKLTGDQLKGVMASILSDALALTCVKHGWVLDAMPGVPITFCSGTNMFRPMDEFGKLVQGKMSTEEWGQQCRELGIADFDLGELMQPSQDS